MLPVVQNESTEFRGSLSGLSWPVDLCVHLSANTTLFWLLHHGGKSCYREVFFRIVLAVLFSLLFHIYFRISLSISTEHLAEIFIEIVFNL